MYPMGARIATKACVRRNGRWRQHRVRVQLRMRCGIKQSLSFAPPKKSWLKYWVCLLLHVDLPRRVTGKLCAAYTRVLYLAFVSFTGMTLPLGTCSCKQGERARSRRLPGVAVTAETSLHPFSLRTWHDSWCYEKISNFGEDSQLVKISRNLLWKEGVRKMVDEITRCNLVDRDRLLRALCRCSVLQKSKFKTE